MKDSALCGVIYGAEQVPENSYLAVTYSCPLLLSVPNRRRNVDGCQRIELVSGRWFDSRQAGIDFDVHLRPTDISSTAPARVGGHLRSHFHIHPVLFCLLNVSVYISKARDLT